MAYSLTQLSTYYDTLANLITGCATSDQISDLTDLITVQHTAVLDLISALTARVQALEDWKIAYTS